jgi:hypothetical protein
VMIDADVTEVLTHSEQATTAYLSRAAHRREQ